MGFQRRGKRTARVVVAVSTWELDELSSSRGEASTVGDLDLRTSFGTLVNAFQRRYSHELTRGRIAS